LQKHWYKKVNLFLLLLLSSLLLNFSGCKEYNTDTAPDNVDNNLMETFTLINMKSATHKLTISPKKLTFHDIEQSVVIINICNTLSSDTSYQLQALSKLQNRYSKELFIVSLFIGDKINTKILKTFIKKNHIIHYVSNDIENNAITNLLLESLSLDINTTLPFTVLYNNGNYDIYYDNATPIEMINYDIQQALKE